MYKRLSYCLVTLLAACISGCGTVGNPVAYKCNECHSVYVVVWALIPGDAARKNCTECGAKGSLRILKKLSNEEYKEAKRKGYYSY